MTFGYLMLHPERTRFRASLVKHGRFRLSSLIDLHAFHKIEIYKAHLFRCFRLSIARVVL
jgi:hypothetical protein